MKRNMQFNFTIDFKFCIVFFLKQCYTETILGVSAVKKTDSPIIKLVRSATQANQYGGNYATISN